MSEIRIALAGNPNCGKTTLFNALTGSNQYVGNWPGVTVEKKEGKLKGHADVTIQDLPGIYSLSPYTLEEVVSRNYLVGDKPDVILNIIDGTNLERNLYLTTQLAETGIPMIIAMNMMDLVKKSGDDINIAELSKRLGCKIVEISALKGQGIKKAAEEAILAAKTKSLPSPMTYTKDVEGALTSIESYADLTDAQKRWYAVKLFEKDEKVLEDIKLSSDVQNSIASVISKVEDKEDDDSEAIITNERYEYIATLLKNVYVKKNAGKLSVSDKIDKIVTNRWLALEVGGLGQDGRHMVTKNDYRFLHTLENMGPSPEPNLTVLYSKRLPENFKEYAAKISVKTSSIQYENDDVMRPIWSDDYSICCCVSATQTGKEMQFFGARANLAKCLLYAINGGKDEKFLDKQGNHMQVGPEYAPITSEYLDYKEVMHKYDLMLDWLAGLYVNILNLIQYMHDKYYYEAAEMALIDTNVRRTFATGIAGFSHVVDSLSAIKYAKVKTVRDESGLVVDYKIEGDFPRYGNDDDRADEIAVWLLKEFMHKIEKYHTYRNSEPTTSILTITSNVVYGKATGALPDGREAYAPFSPGANPAYGAEKNGLLASLNSVAKVPYEYALDGISNTQTISPSALGHTEDEQKKQLVNVLDGYFSQGAHHLNVNVFGIDKLKDAMEHPEKPEYANFTIRVSGYAVKFIDLTREQQLDVIARNAHETL